MHYAKVKREKSGKCNICLKEGPLSWDHVPPQGSYNATGREIRTVLESLTAKEPGPPNTRDSQSGVKYRTICKPCNEWLGAEVDPAYIDFTRQVGMFLSSKLALPISVPIRTKPARLLRSILAHLVAAKSDLDEVIFDRDVRPCCRSLTEPIPENIYFHYWIYPHEVQVVLRDVAMLAERGKFGGPYIFFHLLKSYPIAFLVSDQERYSGLPDLNRLRGSAPNDEVEVQLFLGEVKPLGWPENPADDNILFGGAAIASSVVAMRRA